MSHSPSGRHVSARRILLRAYQGPFDVYSAEQTLAQNRIGDNVGNLLFSHASYRLLSTSRARITTARFLTADPGWINDSFDVVVLPLANAFRRGFVPELELVTALVRRLRIPVVVLGVNAQLGFGAEQPKGDIGEAVSTFVKAVLRRSPSIGVRGELTASYLARLGFGGDQVEVIGCPAMFMSGPTLPPLRKVDGLDRGARISLNVSPYVKGIGRLALEQGSKYPQLIYTAQDIATLRLLLTGTYRSGLPLQPGVPGDADHPLIRAGRTVLPINVRSWIEHLEGFDFSFGTRIHGNIAALLAGTPAFVLTHDSRTSELADYHRIPHLRFTANLEVDAARLYEQADEAATVSAHPERWARFSAFLDAHGLEHIFAPGVEASGFDARAAATAYAPLATFQPDLRVRVALETVAHRVRQQAARVRSRASRWRRQRSKPAARLSQEPKTLSSRPGDSGADSGGVG